jgi:hypothetical protein
MAGLSMSQPEFNRLDVLLPVQSGRLRLTDTLVLIGLQWRPVFRLLRGRLTDRVGVADRSESVDDAQRLLAGT